MLQIHPVLTRKSMERLSIHGQASNMVGNHPGCAYQKMWRQAYIQVQQRQPVLERTDTDSIFYQNRYTFRFNFLPLRYMHSPVEICSMQDGGSIQLMYEAVAGLKADQRF